MTTADRWTQTVRQQLGLGRLLPLGDARDGAWIAEKASAAVLRSAAKDMRGVRLEALRIALTDPAQAQEAAVPQPPGALPPGPLRITADFATTATQPLPETAQRLRALLAATAVDRLGLTVTEVDLRVTALLDEDPGPGAVSPPEPETAAESADAEAASVARADVDADEERIAAVASAVPGVVRLTGLPGGLGRSVHIEERRGEAALPRRHVRVEFAVRADHRAVEVAREVRERVGAASPDHPTVAVLITSVG
ncbi:nucleopolyhedrovirus P10 family protein [Streptomyces sp. M41]|uniref:nucleopolyhedrovirus P10 family protein n=1 Tax=Streptomyces sp. M41 TaxID=3059412 RepID=UPI00374C9E9C